MRRAQRRPDVDEVAQHDELYGGAALDVSTVGPHLEGQLAREVVERHDDAPFVCTQRYAGKDHALERVQACRTVGLPGGDPGEVSRLVREIGQQVVAQFVIAATGEKALELRHPGD